MAGGPCGQSAQPREASTPNGQLPSFHQESTGITRLTLRPYVVHIWSRETSESGGNEALEVYRVVRDRRPHQPRETTGYELLGDLAPHVRKLLWLAMRNRNCSVLQGEIKTILTCQKISKSPGNISKLSPVSEAASRQASPSNSPEPYTLNFSGTLNHKT